MKDGNKTNEGLVLGIETLLFFDHRRYEAYLKNDKEAFRWWSKRITYEKFYLTDRYDVHIDF